MEEDARNASELDKILSREPLIMAAKQMGYKNVYFEPFGVIGKFNGRLLWAYPDAEAGISNVVARSGHIVISVNGNVYYVEDLREGGLAKYISLREEKSL